MANENVIDLVKSLSAGPCSCTYPMGSCGISFNEKTGKTEYKSDLGQKKECLRCRARGALESDSIEYDKDAKVRYSVWL